MEKKYILVSLEDDKAKKLADVLGNKTSNKIINLLAEKEMSEKDLADELNIPINTVEYNLKKLLAADLIEKSKNFFWSPKGRKIDLYQVSNKSIVISPKKSTNLKKFVPIAITLFSGLGALLIKYTSDFVSSQSTRNMEDSQVLYAAEKSAGNIATTAAGNLLNLANNSALIWFFVGIIFGILVLLTTKYLLNKFIKS